MLSPGAKLKGVLHKIGSFQADVILTVFYYLGLGPAYVLVRLAGIDGLRLKETPTNWVERGKVDPAEHLRSQG